MFSEYYFSFQSETLSDITGISAIKINMGFCNRYIFIHRAQKDDLNTIDLRRTYCLVYWRELPPKETRARGRCNEQNRFSILQVGDPIASRVRRKSKTLPRVSNVFSRVNIKWVVPEETKVRERFSH